MPMPPEQTPDAPYRPAVSPPPPGERGEELAQAAPPAAPRPESALRRVVHRVPWGALVGFLLFGLALWAIHHELKSYRYSDVRDSFRAIPAWQLAVALVLTLVNYVVLTGYDTLGFRYIRHPLRYPKIALASFIGYAFSNNIGLSAVSGASVRYRLYTSWGLQPGEIAQVVGFYLTTLWLGLFSLAGVLFIAWPLQIPPGLHLPFDSLRAPGLILLGIVGAYVALVVGRRGKALQVRRFTLPIPGKRLAAAQLLVSALDWGVAGLVLYALVPKSDMPLGHFLAIYLLAQVAGLASQVPGGLGIFESIMLVLAGPQIGGQALLGALLAYRLVYYLVPLLLATLLLGAHEAAQRRAHFARLAGTVRAFAGTWGPELVPRMLAVATFANGVVLLVSGATPALPGRLRLLEGIVPLAVVEASHFLASILGLSLLLLARGLQLRLDAAWSITSGLLVAGVVVCLLKGDFEQAFLLAALFAALWPCHAEFYRRARLTSEPFTAKWIAAIAVAVGASVWLGSFAFKHVAYSDELFWHFALYDGDAPRFLRATVGVFAAALGFSLYKLLRPAPLHTLPKRTRAVEEERLAEAIVERSPNCEAALALLGDKRLLFNQTDTAFVQYGVEGRSFVSMGDPIGPQEQLADLVWDFHEWVDHHGGFTVFYEVPATSLPYYLDLGLNVLKVGEEAIVPLGGFTLEGPEHKGMRAQVRKLEREGCVFELVPKEEVPALFPELRAISDAWLREKDVREKGFSLGFYDERYLRHFPVAVVRLHGRIVAFANVWVSGERHELSPDLMRYDPATAPKGVMEYLFVELMLWGQAEGYRRFNLGMAPLAGMPDRQLAPLWGRLGALLFRHGEHFFQFQGLRAFKERFDPVWEPRYVAYAGGMLRLPGLLANVASLVAAGRGGLVR